MKISNFRNLVEKNGTLKAEVDVETGWLFWKKTETKEVFAKSPSGSWRWLDDGGFAYGGGHDVQDLYQAYRARKVLTASTPKYTEEDPLGQRSE